MAYGFRMRIRYKGLELLLRPYRDDEIKLMLPGMQSYWVARYITIAGAQTLEMERTWLERVAGEANHYIWAICVVTPEHPEGIPIGTTTLEVRINPRGYLVRGHSGVVIYDRTHWGKGVASAAHLARTLYAVEVLNLPAILSGVIQGNTGSRRALEKVGYCFTGTEYAWHVVDSGVRHLDGLLWVNPAAQSWNYFWGDSEIPDEFHEARKRARAALRLARKVVTFE